MALITPHTRANQTTTNNEDRDPAQIWLNVGFVNEDPETGEEIFVSLPMGIALDQMKPARVSGKNEDYRKLMEGKNRLLDMLQGFAEGLEPGEEEIISDLSIQVRRVAQADPSEASADQNPHVASIDRLSFAKGSRRAA